MLVPIRPLRESSITHLAFIRFLTGMYSHVSPQILLGAERFLAKLALKGFLTSVYPFVDFQVSFLSETLGAEPAAMRFFTGVRSLVKKQVAGTGERLLAVRTFVVFLQLGFGWRRTDAGGSNHRW